MGFAPIRVCAQDAMGRLAPIDHPTRKDPGEIMPVNNPLPDACLDQTFRNARTRNGWLDQDVPETLIRATYDLLKLGPTSANNSPGRFLWLKKGGEARERLIPHLMEGNQAKTKDAPWTVIVAWDWNFHEKIPQLFPHNPGAKDWFADETSRFDNRGRRADERLEGQFRLQSRLWRRHKSV